MSFDQFKERIVSSGLIHPKIFEEFLKSFSEDQKLTAEDLARDLYKAKLLTKYQLQLISQGMGQLLTFGDYVLQDRIGSGGMGTVYRAIHTKMNRAVAIKILNPKLSLNSALLDRFDREVRATAKLQHVNIVHAYDAGEHNRAHFLVMELVEGVDLNRVIAEKGPLSVPHALECVTQVAEGLKYAHFQGIIHRDVKPSNILLSRTGVIKLSDMGLVRVSRDWDDSEIEKLNANLSRTGLLMGSVNFMSPEQAMDSRDAEERSDIYSLGATLYYLLTGKTMFSADTATKTILEMQTTSPPSIRSVRSDVSDELEAVYLKMVARQPDDRFPTMGHVLDAIRNCAASNQVRASLTGLQMSPSSLSDPHIFDSDLSLEEDEVQESKGSSVIGPKNPSVNVLDDDSIHDDSNDATLMQMLPRKQDSELIESAILQEVNRSNRRAMIAVLVPLSLAVIYFFARSLQQIPPNPVDALPVQSVSSDQDKQARQLRELLPDLDKQVWSVLIPENLTSQAGATFHVHLDGSIEVSGQTGTTDQYTISAPLDTHRMTGVRLEVLPPSGLLPAEAAPAEKEFHLTGLALGTHLDSAKDIPAPARFRAAYTDYYQSLRLSGEPLFVSHVLDGNPETAWAVGTRFRLPHWAVFETDPNSVAAETRAVTISLDSGDSTGTSETLRRFRILVTDKPRPMLQEMIRNGNLSDREKLAAAYLILGNPREASDLLQSAMGEGSVENGTRLVLLATALQEQLLIGPARRASEDLAVWLKENRTAHPLLLSLSEHVLMEVGGMDHNQTEQILDCSKLEYQAAAWTEKIQESPFSQSEFYLRRRAATYARLGQWKKAAADFLKVAREAEVEDDFLLDTLLALALCNDLDNLRELGRTLSEKTSERKLGVISAQLQAEGILMHPEGTPFVEKYVEVLDRELPQLAEDSPLLPDVLLTRGLAYYRTGNSQEALKCIDRSLNAIVSRDEQSQLNLAPVRAAALSVQSLALYETGNAGEATKSLQAASELIPSHWKKLIDPTQPEAVIFECERYDRNWLIAATLMREAAISVSAQHIVSKIRESLAL